MRISGYRSADAQPDMPFTAGTNANAARDFGPQGEWAPIYSGNAGDRDPALDSPVQRTDRGQDFGAARTRGRPDDGPGIAPIGQINDDHNGAAPPATNNPQAPHIRDSWNPDTGTHTRDAWDEQSGKHMHDTWDANGEHVRDTLDENTGVHTHDKWTADGMHARDSWDEAGDHLHEVWSTDGDYQRDTWNELERRMRDTHGQVPPRPPVGAAPYDARPAPETPPPGMPANATRHRTLMGRPRRPINDDREGRFAPAGPMYGPRNGGTYTAGRPAGGTSGGAHSAAAPGPAGGTLRGNPAGHSPRGMPPAGATPSAGPSGDAASFGWPAGQPGFVGFSDNQRRLLRNAFQHTKRMVDAALAQLHKTGGLDRNFEKWFGALNQANLREVERVLTNMQRTLAKGDVTFDALPRTRDNWEMAHVFPAAGAHRVYIRPHLFDYPFGPKTLETTIAHELSHFNNIGGTRDLLYGPDNVQMLARRNGWAATHNAENYGMFIREQTAA